jgi:ABC-type glycerol-3-phosphate transport system substrate-binding protein
VSRSAPVLTRRHVLAGAGAAAAALLAACTGAQYAATPTTAPAAKPADAKPAAAEPTKPAAVAPTPAAGAAPTQPASAAPATAAPAAKPATSGGPVTITFMSWSAADSLGRKIDVALTEEYMKANPGVTIKTEDVPFNDYMKKLQTMFAADIGPDVLWDSIWRQPRFVQAGAVIALDDLVKGDSSVPKYTPTALEMGKYKGKLYGLPLGASTWVVHYNSALFKEAGLKTPGELKAANQWSFDALKDAALKIGKREGDRLVTQGYMTDRQAYTWMNYAYNNGAQFVDKGGAKFVADSKESIEALQWLADFVLTHKVSPTLTDQQGGDYVPRFSTGKLAMMTYWAGGAIDVKNVVKDKFDFDVIELPVNKPGRESGGYWHANLINVNSKAKSRDHAWGVGKLAAGTKAEIMRIESGQLSTPVIDDPGLIETYKKTTPVKNGLVVIDLLKTPVPLPYNENWEEQRFTVVEPYMAEVYDGKKKVAETVADINKKLNDLSPKD